MSGFISFVVRFCIEFEGPEPRKTSKNLEKNKVFQESDNLVLGPFLIPKSLQNAVKIHPETINKSIKK